MTRRWATGFWQVSSGAMLHSPATTEGSAPKAEVSMGRAAPRPVARTVSIGIVTKMVALTWRDIFIIISRGTTATQVSMPAPRPASDSLITTASQSCKFTWPAESAASTAPTACPPALPP
eukprot:4571026-Prymnesium_polylepis.2